MPATTSYTEAQVASLRDCWSSARREGLTSHADHLFNHYSLAGDLLRNADAAAELADRVEAWGQVERNSDRLSAHDLLGIIQQLDKVANDAARCLHNPIIGRNTRASHGNECSIALGISWTNPQLRSNPAYTLVHSMTTAERVESGQYNDVSPSQSQTAVAAARMRVYASSARVVAQIVAEVGLGKYQRVG